MELIPEAIRGRWASDRLICHGRTWLNVRLQLEMASITEGGPRRHARGRHWREGFLIIYPESLLNEQPTL